MSLLSCCWLFSSDDYNAFAVGTSENQVMILKQTDQTTTLNQVKPIRILSIASSAAQLQSLDLWYIERSTISDSSHPMLIVKGNWMETFKEQFAATQQIEEEKENPEI